MKFVVFGGTTEGRELSRRIAARGGTVTVCVATDYGREEQGEMPGITVLTGRRGQSGMEALLRDAVLCIDATHPYATEVTKTLRAACRAAGVPYRRLSRAASGVVDGSDGARIVPVADAQKAAAYLKGTAGNILLTTGAKELPCFAGLDAARLYPRILPTREGLSVCEALGVPHRNIIAMQGPFSRELNEALIHQYHIRYLVTKDGGVPGGFPEKAAAAANTGVTLILLRRPAETGEGFAEIAAACETLLAGGGTDGKEQKEQKEQGEGRP